MARIGFSEDLVRPLQYTPFAQSQRQAQILTRLRRVNFRNIQYIPAVKIIAFLDLDQHWIYFKGLLVLLEIPEIPFFEQLRHPV
jgi:hypothetical protein